MFGQVLSDEKKRALYDKEGEKGLENPPEADPLSAMFGKKKANSVEPVVVKLDVELHDLYTGKDDEVSFEKSSTCR